MSVVAHQCPQCGGHLADTWDDVEDECCNCGFAYVAEREVEPAETLAEKHARVRREVTQMAAGYASVIVAIWAGMALHASSAVQTTETATGAEAITFSFDAAFWTAMVLGVVALLLTAYSVLPSQSASRGETDE